MGRLRTYGKTAPVTKTWLSAQEACAYLGIKRDMLKRIRESGEVTFSRFGSKTIWYELASIDRFLQRNVIFRAS